MLEGVRLIFQPAHMDRVEWRGMAISFPLTLKGR
jgi:hypothetical protein